MSCAIRLLRYATGESSRVDGEYVCDYEPASMDEHGIYRKDGTLVTSSDIRCAKKFETTAEAFLYYAKSNGVRPDGKPNRPLTAWHVEIAPTKERSLYESRSSTH